MEPQRERLPEWVEQYLDEAKMVGEVDPISFYVLQLYAERTQLSAIVNQFHLATAPRNRYFFADLFVAIADELWPVLPLPIKRGLLRYAFLDLNLMIREAAEWIADWAMTDQCEGGARKPYNRAPRPGLYSAWFPTKRAARRLRSPAFMRRYMAGTKEFPRKRWAARRVLGLLETYGMGSRGEQLAALAPLQEMVPSTMPQPEYRRELLEWAVKQAGGRILPNTRRYRKPGQRRINRAALFAASLLGAQEVSKFARGEPIKIVGPQITFAVQKRVARLAQAGHGCLDISMKATNGPLLGTLCFYIEETPVLDQLAAIALHAQAGVEHEILAIGNLITVAEEGLDYPLIQERRATALAAAIQNPEPFVLDVRAGGRRWDYDPNRLRQERRERYWAEWGELWTAVVAEYVLGASHMRYFRPRGAA
jgi:hypothetical protein